MLQCDQEKPAVVGEGEKLFQRHLKTIEDPLMIVTAHGRRHGIDLVWSTKSPCPSSGVGHPGVQFAKARGVRMVGIDARDEGVELTEEGGADVVVDARNGHAGVVKQCTLSVSDAPDAMRTACTLNASDAQDAMGTAWAITKMHGAFRSHRSVLSVFSLSFPPRDQLHQRVQRDDFSRRAFQELIFRDIRVRGSLIVAGRSAPDAAVVLVFNSV
ncbi:hypothetical protein SVAN01_10050 [Stagonosporopsis vannaccii]|nr:hypothetical protein SVAN01_10050 [Stagonosporopsis vannaccii]